MCKTVLIRKRKAARPTAVAQTGSLLVALRQERRLPFGRVGLATNPTIFNKIAAKREKRLFRHPYYLEG